MITITWNTFRRSLLATLASGGSLTVAGCSGSGDRSRQVSGDPGRQPVAALPMTPTGPQDVAERVSYDPDSQGQSSRKFAARVVESDGQYTVVSVDRPFPPGRPFVHDGAVYELNADVVDAVPATTFRLSFAETGDGDDVAAESVAYADLPRVDRSALSEIGFDDGPHFDLREYPVTYWDRRIEDSALMLDPVRPVIEWDER